MLRLRILGGLSLESDGRPIDAAAQRKTLVLLAVVASASGSGISRDKLVAFFWPDSDDEHARNALRQRLFALRRLLGTDDPFIGTTELRLNPEIITTDLADFEAAIAADDLETASKLYAGPLLDGIHVREAPELERWVEERRGRIAARAAGALRSAALAASRRGEHNDAVRWWRRLAELDPVNAEAARGLMTSLADAGDAAGALQHYRVYETLVRQQLGVDPDSTVVSLGQRIRSGERTRAAVSTPSVLREQRDVPVLVRPDGINETPPVPRATSRVPYLVIGAGIAAFAVLLLIAPRVGANAPPALIGSTVQLTRTPELELDPALSPDGKLVAYAAGVPGETRIFVRQISGGRTVQLSGDLAGEHRWPSWSPDGGEIVFSANKARTSRLFVVPALGGGMRLLTDKGRIHSSPAWSPDGTRIAYAVLDSIVIVELSEGSSRAIGTPSLPHSLAWAPNGKQLAFVSQNPAYVFSGELGNLGTSSVWTISLDGSPARAITSAKRQHASPVWMPDGQGLLYLSNMGGVNDLYYQELGGSGERRGEPSSLTTGLGAHGINLSRDGSKMIYSVLRQRSNIYRAPISGRGTTVPSAVHPVTNENQKIEIADVSPDGAWLAFDSDRSGTADIYKMPSSGGEPVRLTNDPAGAFNPRWSRDGTRIVFQSWRNGNRDVYTMNANGGELGRVTSDPRHDYYPDWAPDKHRVVFLRTPYRSGEAVDKSQISGTGIMVAAVGNDGRWASEKQLAPPPALSPRWTRDGHYVAHIRNDTLAVLPIDGTAPRALTSKAILGGTLEYATVGPDTTVVYVRAVDSTGTHSIFSVPISGGQPRLLLRLSGPLRPQRFEFSTDSRNLYFTITESDSDLWMLDLHPRGRK